MAITNKTTSFDKFHPVYNPVVYAFESTNINKPGFRYVVEVFLKGTSDLIYEGRIAPRPGDGIGYIDLSKILSNYVKGQVKLTNVNSYLLSDSFINYDVKIGEEYQEVWYFNDTEYGASGYTNLVQSPQTAPHSYSIGDQILIKCNNPNLFPNINGLLNVTQVVNNYKIRVNVNFMTTSANPGNITFADGRKTVTRGILIMLDRVAYNAAFSFNDWYSYNYQDYNLIGNFNGRQMLSNIPEGYTVYESQDVFVNYSANDGSASFLTFKNSNGDVFQKSINNNNWLLQVACGPNNQGYLNTISGTPGLIKPNTTYYDVYIQNSNGSASTKKIRINIDRRCKIDNYEILFEDRKGSYSSYSFPLRSKETGTVKRETYNQQTGDIEGSKWRYSLSEGGDINYNITIDKKYKLLTNWMTNGMNVYFEELITSPNTYVKINGGEYIRCVIQDSTFEIQSKNYKKLIQRSVTIKLSNQNTINI